MSARPEFDQRDAAILADRAREYAKLQGPRVGDFVRMTDGTERRFTHDWGSDIQTTYRWRETGKVEAGSFYLGVGYIEYSGSLDSAIPKAELRDTGETKHGAVWFFHHHEVRAHNGVHTETLFRVYEHIPGGAA